MPDERLGVVGSVLDQGLDGFDQDGDAGDRALSLQVESDAGLDLLGLVVPARLRPTGL